MKKPTPDLHSMASLSILIFVMFAPPFTPNAIPWALAGITANMAMTTIEIIVFFIVVLF
jgi:hypothetical protein